jgi:hypothetical protein
MALTFEQYKALRQKGLTDEEIRKQTSQKTGGLIGGIAKFLGIEELGRGLGVSAAGTETIEQGADRIREQQDKVLAQIHSNKEQGKDSTRLKEALKKSLGYDVALEITDTGTGGLSNREVIGSGAQLGLNLIGIRGGLPAGKTIVQKAAAGAASGALFGGAETFKEGEGVVPGAIKGAAIGGVAGALLGVAEKAISAATTKSPEILMSKVLRQGRADLAAEATGRKPVLARQMIEQGIKGSDEAIIEKSAGELASLEAKLQATLTSSDKTIPTARLVDSLDEIARRKQNVFGDKGVQVINDFKDLVIAKGETLSLVEANQLKRDIYKELSEAAFNADVLPTNKEVLRKMASAIRNAMSDISPEIADINAQQQFYIRVIDNVERQLQNKGKLNLLGLSDSIFASAGIAGGEPVAAVSTGLAKRAIESTQFRTRAAIGLDKLGKAIETLPVDEFGNIRKTVLLDALAKLVGEE